MELFGMAVEYQNHLFENRLARSWSWSSSDSQFDTVVHMKHRWRWWIVCSFLLLLRRSRLCFRYHRSLLAANWSHRFHRYEYCLSTRAPRTSHWFLVAWCCQSSGRHLFRKDMLWRHLSLRTQPGLFKWFNKFYSPSCISAWTRWSSKSWMDLVDIEHLRLSRTCYLCRIYGAYLSEEWILLGAWSHRRGGQSSLNHKFSYLCIWYHLKCFEKYSQLFLADSGSAPYFIFFTPYGFDRAHFRPKDCLKREQFSSTSFDPWVVQSRAPHSIAQYGLKEQLLGCLAALETAPSGSKSLTWESTNQLLADLCCFFSMPA